jgi:hypothetical protein
MKGFVMAKAAPKKAAKKEKPKAKAAAKPAKAAKAAPKPAKAAKATKAPKAEKAAKTAPAADTTDEMNDVEAVAETAVAPKAKKVKAPKAKSAKALAAEKAIADENRKWSELKDKYAAEKAAAYTMSATYEANRPLMHKVLGWGFITSVQNDRLEVLFEHGTKLLISNYKPG